MHTRPKTTLLGNRRGSYSLVEAVTVLVISVILAAVVIPSVSETAEKTQDLYSVADALGTFGDALKNFHDDTNHYPSFLSHLSEPITTGMNNSCDKKYPGGAVGAWTGPYSTKLWGSTSIPVAIGTLQNQLVRTEHSSKGGPTGFAGFLHLLVTGVELDTAEELQALLDGDEDETAGAVQWDAPVGATVTLKYVVPIAGC